MDNKINEAYINNLSKYMHLLAVNEIFEEIKKEGQPVTMKKTKKIHLKKR